MGYQCNICDTVYKTKQPLHTPKCCQINSESKYQLCKKCIKRLDKCPWCRSPKTIDIAKSALFFEIQNMLTKSVLFDLVNEELYYLKTKFINELRGLR